LNTQAQKRHYTEKERKAFNRKPLYATPNKPWEDPKIAAAQ